MSERKELASKQQEPGEVPGWMLWVASEDQATRTDVKAEIKDVREEVRATRTDLKAEIKASEERQGKLLHAEVGSVRTEVGSVRAEVGSVRTELKADIKASEGRMVTKTAAMLVAAVAFLTWMDSMRDRPPAAAPVETAALMQCDAPPSAVAEATGLVPRSVSAGGAVAGAVSQPARE